MNNWEFGLDPGSKKFFCPICRKKKWVRWMNLHTKEYLPEQYGKCDGANTCDYKHSPKHDGYIRKILAERNKLKQPTNNPQTIRLSHGLQAAMENPPTRPSGTLPALPREAYIPQSVLKESCKNYHKSGQFKFLLNKHSEKRLREVFEKYRLGCYPEGYMEGAGLYPYIDIKGNVTAIQAIKIHTEGEKAGHRKNINFIHSLLSKWYKSKGKVPALWLEDYHQLDIKIRCLLGEHLLALYSKNPVYLFEDPKTAIISAVEHGLPKSDDDPICLAVFNLSSFTLEKCRVLAHKRIYLFPDYSSTGKPYKEWKEKAEEYQKKIPGFKYSISSLLEKASTLEMMKDDKIGDVADVASSSPQDIARLLEFSSGLTVKYKSEDQALHIQYIEDSSFPNIENPSSSPHANRIAPPTIPNALLEEKLGLFKAIGFGVASKRSMTTEEEEFYLPPSHEQSVNTPMEKGLDQMKNKNLTIKTLVADNSFPSANPWDLSAFKGLYERLTDESIKLDNASTIINPKKFFLGHLAIVKANNGNPIYEPYYDRLIEIAKKFFSN